MNRVRRGVILPVVLVVLLLLGVVAAAFSFRVHADLSSTQAMTFRLQTRLAALAGVEKAKLVLRNDLLDTGKWYHNPEEFNRIIVWSREGDETTWGSDEEFTDQMPAFRFSIVADDPTDDEEFCRYGITDESSKLNLNEATAEQLLLLVTAAVDDDEEIIPQEIVDAIMDWRDTDEVPRGEDGDTEGDYYEQLEPTPYKVRNGPFDSVEELLLVKGVTARILYGEDRDQNGLLTPNEDDGDDSYPPDNEDNILNRGLYPYLTVLSYENNVSNSNRLRVYMFGDEAGLRAQLAEDFEDEPGVVDFIVSATRNQQPSAGEGAGAPSGGGSGSRPLVSEGGGRSRGGEPRGEARGGRRGSRRTEGRSGEDTSPANREPKSGRKSGSRKRRQVDESGDKEPPDDRGLIEDMLTPVESEEDPSGRAEESEDQASEGDESEAGTKESAGGTSGDGAGITSPAALLKVEGANPLTVEHLPILMDRLTAQPPQVRRLAGLININTAPRLVLRCLPGLTGEQVSAIIQMRSGLEVEKKQTTAWLVTEEVLDLDTYIEIASLITARGQQFTIESLGYADHLGMVTRLQVIVDMVGPMAQVIYNRDVTHLGGSFPIREEDKENIRVQQ